MSQLATKLAAGKQVITAEITPPKGPGIKKLCQHAQLLGPLADAINITDCQRALVKMSSLAACRILLDQGVEPVYQLTCRDRNSIALQADLMGAGALQIPNVLCLTGDPVKVGDSPQSKSVFEMESTGLLTLASFLQKGMDASGNKMNTSTKFFLGAVVNPSMSASETQLSRMEKKVGLGASFFQTQANYDLEDFRLFLIEAKKRCPYVLAGILVLHSREIADFIHDNIPGIRLPDAILDRFRSTADAEKFAVEFAVETMLSVKDVSAGFHIMSVRREDLIAKTIETYRARATT